MQVGGIVIILKIIQFWYCFQWAKNPEMWFSISRRLRLTKAIRNDTHGPLYVFSSSHISFYKIVKKNQWDLQRPCWRHHRGSKIYHLKLGDLKQYLSLFYGSDTFIWPNDLHLSRYQGHTYNFKVVRERKRKIHIDTMFLSEE